MDAVRWWRQSIPWGDIVVEVGAAGVTRISLSTAVVDEFVDAPRRDPSIARQLEEYFAGRRQTFDVAVDLPRSLSDLQRRVLLTLRDDVGYGETVTYGELAEMVGRPGAARAVGSTMARNPVPFLIPCHRVVAAHGIGGYGDGVALKRALLDLEAGLTPPLGPPGRAGRPRSATPVRQVRPNASLPRSSA
jgi:methylated-DNA-[protein]-cysteine S-methyltransferase